MPRVNPRVALGGLLPWLAGACHPAGAAPVPTPVTTGIDRPDIVFVLADDLDLAQMEFLPRLQKLVGDAGATFTNDFVSLSLCCPSRCTTLTGQYAHNTGVYRNNGPNGGFSAFHRAGEAHTIATALEGAGYRTGLFGKYLNGYPGRDTPDWIPPGWTRWFAVTGAGGYPEYNYTMNADGVRESHGKAPDDYLVDVLADRVGRFLEGAGTQPAFAWVAPMVPHTPATVAPRYADRFLGVKAPRTASFNEADMADKPHPLADRPPLSEKALRELDDLYRRRLASALALEDLVQSIVDVQTARSRLDHTYLVFTSDNGFHLGQHRNLRGKETEFEEDLRVPLLVRGPGIEPGLSVSQLTVNTDLAPTFADMAGLGEFTGADGRSWLPLAQGRPPPVWRDAFLLERSHHGVEEPEGDTDGRKRQPAFVGVRTATWKYLEYDDGQRALYDLAADPAELDNLASASPPVMSELAARLARLATCAGETCREAENPPSHAEPVPPARAVP